MLRRTGILLAAFSISAFGCATADDAGISTGKQDTGKSTTEAGGEDAPMNGPKDTGADSASADDTGTSDDTGSAGDTGSAADTTVVMDTEPVDSGTDTAVVDTAPVDSGAVGKFLIFDDTSA